MKTESSTDVEAAGSGKVARYALIMLTIAYALNFVDRQIMSPGLSLFVTG